MIEGVSVVSTIEGGLGVNVKCLIRNDTNEAIRLRAGTPVARLAVVFKPSDDRSQNRVCMVHAEDNPVNPSKLDERISRVNPDNPSNSDDRISQVNPVNPSKLDEQISRSQSQPPTPRPCEDTNVGRSAVREETKTNIQLNRQKMKKLHVQKSTSINFEKAYDKAFEGTTSSCEREEERRLSKRYSGKLTLEFPALLLMFCCVFLFLFSYFFHGVLLRQNVAQ